MTAYREDEQGNLVFEDGTVIPAAKRGRTEVYSRVVGYLRPVEMWNVGKQEEFADREVYRVPAESAGIPGASADILRAGE